MGVRGEARGCVGDMRIREASGGRRRGPWPVAHGGESAGVVGEETEDVGHGGGLDLGTVSMTCMTPTRQNGQRARLSSGPSSTAATFAASAGRGTGGGAVTGGILSSARASWRRVFLDGLNRP